MQRLTTKQGRVFNANDILLYEVNNDKIMLVLNDSEQMRMYNYSKREEDMPVAELPYSVSTLSEVVSSMKRIKTYEENDKNINLEYEDGTCAILPSSKQEAIEKNFLEQMKRERNGYYGAASDENHEKRRFKVLQVEKYRKEADEEGSKAVSSQIWIGTLAIIAITMYNMSVAGDFNSEFAAMLAYFEAVAAAGGIIPMQLKQMVEAISKKTALNIKADELIEQLKEINLEENENSRGAK